MNTRIARKVLKPTISKRLRKRLHKLYPPYISERGTTVYPSWHMYYRFAKAWVLIHRKTRKYGQKFKQL